MPKTFLQYYRFDGIARYEYPFCGGVGGDLHILWRKNNGVNGRGGGWVLLPLARVGFQIMITYLYGERIRDLTTVETRGDASVGRILCGGRPNSTD